MGRLITVKDGQDPAVQRQVYFYTNTTTVADDGDLRTIDTLQEAIDLDLTANSSGNSTASYSAEFLFRLFGKLMQAIASTITTLTKGAGTVTSNTLRATLASDVALPAGENLLGSVGGNTVPVSDQFTRPADTTAYAVDDVVSNSTTTTTVLTFAQAARKNGGTGYVTNARLVTNNSSTTNASFRLWLYNQAPATPPVDNSPFALLWANRGIRLGFIDFVLSSAGTGSDSASATVTNINLRLNTQPDSRNVFGLLIARAAYTPASGQQFFVDLTFEQN